MKTVLAKAAWVGILALIFAGCSNIAGDGGTPLPATAYKDFIYVTNEGSAVISAYTYDRNTGALTAVPGSPFGSGLAPRSVAIDPAGKFAYVACWGSSSLDVYAIDPSTGALRTVPTQATSANPNSIVVDARGRFAYVAISGADAVAAFRIDVPSPGQVSLTPVDGSSVPAGSGPCAVAINDDYRNIYVANRNSNNLSAYRFNIATGALSEIPGSPFPAGQEPAAIAAHGDSVIVANAGSNDLSVYRVLPYEGGLVEIPSSPFPTGAGPCSVTADPKAHFMYVTNMNSNNISVFRNAWTNYAINWVEIPGSPFPAGAGPSSAAVDPNGKFVFVTNRGANTLSVYAIDPTSGSLFEVKGSPYPVGDGPYSVAAIQIKQ